jgi:hypothetical protein
VGRHAVDYGAVAEGLEEDVEEEVEVVIDFELLVEVFVLPLELREGGFGFYLLEEEEAEDEGVDDVGEDQQEELVVHEVWYFGEGNLHSTMQHTDIRHHPNHIPQNRNLLLALLRHNPRYLPELLHNQIKIPLHQSLFPHIHRTITPAHHLPTPIPTGHTRHRNLFF